MSLFIEVYVGSRTNRKLVAHTHLYNISDLADISDYEFTAEEFGNEKMGIPAALVKDRIKGHVRNQSVYALVKKVAESFLEDDESGK